MIGQTIPHNTILEKLGEGGMGVVCKARDADPEREVAPGRDRVHRTVALITFVLTAHAVSAQAHHDNAGPRFPIAPEKISVNYAKQAVQGFDMRMWISNQAVVGQKAFDNGIPLGMDPQYGLEYPTGSGIEHLWGAGPMIGGIVDGSRRISEAWADIERRKSFRPDANHPLRELIWKTSAGDSLTEPNRRGCDDDGDGRVDEDDLDGLDNDGDWVLALDDVGSDGIPDEMEVGCRGGYNETTNPDPAFDNYQRTATDWCHPDATGNFRKKDDPDAYTEGNGVPDHGEPHVDEDYAAISDRDLYCSARDDNDVPAGHYPMGIKVIQKCYAWADDFARAIIPFDYYFINTSSRMIRDVYVGFFAELDVGPVSAPEWYWERNYSCYFDSLMTAYVHNPIDRGSTPVGITALGTPKPLSELKFIYQWFNWTTRPISWEDSAMYSMMSGEAYSGKLIATCESPTNPSDVKMVFSFGPFEEFAPGETLKISVALVAGEGVESGPNNLKENAQRAIKLYKNGYTMPVTLPSPSLRHTEGSQSVRLEWGGGAGPANPMETWDDSNKFVEGLPPDHWRRINPPCDLPGGSSGCSSGRICDSSGNAPGGRIFEGYRLYRSEDPGDEPQQSTFALIREYDMMDDGLGYEMGLDSVFVDSPLVRGKRYWYSVTSFGIPNIAIVDRPTPGGGIARDTLYSEGSESPIVENRIRVDMGFSASDGPDQVMVVPNPYRVDQNYTFENGGWEGRGRDWNETKRKIKFIHLPRKCTIRIFGLTGDVIATIPFEASADQPDRGEFDWDLLSESTRALASGVYVFTVESEFGRQIGKFVLIR